MGDIPSWGSTNSDGTGVGGGEVELVTEGVPAVDSDVTVVLMGIDVGTTPFAVLRLSLWLALEFAVELQPATIIGRQSATVAFQPRQNCFQCGDFLV
jgi:hypothetical protein